MTFWAMREPESNLVSVQLTSGPVTMKVTEPAHHLRHFWGQLGQVLDDAEKNPGEPAPADQR